MESKFRIEIISSEHQRESFCCGVEPLDNYLKKLANQDIKRRIANCYAAIENSTDKIAGYYTLSASAVSLADIPKNLAKKLPRYPSVPVAILGRLAVDKNYQKQRLGAALLWDAINRSIKSEIMVFALIVDSKDKLSTNFYMHHGFIKLESMEKKLILPLTSIAKK